MRQLLDPKWEYVADNVMGGVSRGTLATGNVQDQRATRLTGEVSLDNNGGFLQMAFDFRPDGHAFDARGWLGVELDLRGNDETYDLRLRTCDLDRPWQSYRSSFVAPERWTAMRFAFSDLEAYRTDAQFNPATLRRLGLVAVGREFTVDLSVRSAALFR